MYKNLVIGITIPAYNEEKLLANTVNGLPDFVDSICIVNDQSTDATGDVGRELAKDNDKVFLLTNPENLGVGGSIINGNNFLVQKEVDVIAIFAGDNQMPPEYLPMLLDMLIDGNFDFVKANRLFKQEKNQMPLFRLVGNRIISLLDSISSGAWEVSDTQNGYTVVRTIAWRRINIKKLMLRYQYETSLIRELKSQNMLMADVFIPSKYGEEQSQISLKSFIPTMSIYLLKGWIARILKGFKNRDFVQFTISTIYSLFFILFPILLFFNDNSLFTIVFTIIYPLIAVYIDRVISMLSYQHSISRHFY